LSLSRSIHTHRSGIVFSFIVIACIASLASGARGKAVGDGVRGLVGLASLPFLVAFDKVGDGTTYVAGLLTNYHGALQAADGLTVELVQLQQQAAALDEMRQENRRLRSMLEFRRVHPQFTLMPAEVVQHARGVLTIDLGSLQGIEPAMAVITPRGVVGIVTQVGPLTSSVATLQSAECRIDAMIEWNRVRGRVIGSGNELSGLCRMHYIDLTETVREGDQVVTSPDSVFPPGFPIGRVAGTPNRGHMSQSVAVIPAADPFRVDEVFVLVGASRDWRNLARTANPTVAVPAGELDIETIQEQFAP